jgi:drug/metabolite transporter (DMT)-like permease
MNHQWTGAAVIESRFAICSSRMTTNTAVFFGAFNPLSRRQGPLSPGVWTLVGGLAIPLWATWPALSLQTRQMPVFECLTIAFLVGWLVLARMERTVIQADPSSWSSWVLALAFALGSSGSAAFFLLATHYIATAEANLISYLWPGMTVGFGAVLGIFHLRLRHVMGLVLGFAGVAILMWGRTFSLSYGGIGLALLGGISWALYCVFRLKWKGATGPLLARGSAISAVLCGVLHIVLEPSVIPSAGSAAAAVTAGIVPTAFGYLAWDEGFRKGDSRLLAVMAYGTPVCSALVLFIFGLESFTWRLLIVAVVIAVAGVMSRADA